MVWSCHCFSGRDPACRGNQHERPYLLERLPARVRIPLSEGEHAIGTQKRAMLGCSYLVPETAEPKDPQPLNATTILLLLMAWRPTTTKSVQERLSSP